MLVNTVKYENAKCEMRDVKLRYGNEHFKMSRCCRKLNTYLTVETMRLRRTARAVAGLVVNFILTSRWLEEVTKTRRGIIGANVPILIQI